MENIWKKVSKRPGAHYVDCFQNVGAKFEKEISNRLSKQILRQTAKKSTISTRLRKREAIEKNLSTTFKRKKTATKRGSRRKSLNLNVTGAFEPKLSFAAHDQFSDIANVLEIKENNKYGRHVIAKCDIAVGMIIAVGTPFAEAVVCNSIPKKFYCLTCKKTDVEFIGCENCDDVQFCSEECRSSNNVHYLECNSIYHRIESCEVKLAVQMVLVAISNYSDANTLIERFETLLSCDPVCPNGLMLSLKRSSRDDIISRAHEAFQYLMAMPNIQARFNTKVQQRFLMHLVCHYLAIIPSNAWDIHLNDDKNLEMKYIYDFISLFNHSCAPNAFYSINGNYGFCLTTRPIRKGEQVFVSYLGDRIEETTANRQSYIKKEWGFICDCERCKLRANRNDPMVMIDDASWKYIDKYYDDYLLPFNSKRRKQLKNECVNFLTKYGYSWSKTLDNVTKLFILVVTHEKK